MRLNSTSICNEIILDKNFKLGESQNVPNRVQILKTGKFSHPEYGVFEITSTMLTEMKSHFENRVRGTDISFDYYHDSDKDASAWVKSLELSDDTTELWAVVDWTPKAAAKIAERELRYFSPDFSLQWSHPETGVLYNNVLFGGGLTNRPFLKEMAAIVADEKTKKGNLMSKTIEQLTTENLDLAKKNIKLSEDCKKLEEQLAEAPAMSKVQMLEKQIAELQSELAKEKQAGETMLKEKTQMAEEIKMAEKTTKFNTLLSEGKAVAAQKEAYLKGDMDKFMELAEKTNPKGQGRSGDTTKDGDLNAQIIKLAEEKVKANPKLAHHEAISIAKKELTK